MSRILLGVSGGVAAYKALEFVRLATAAGHVGARRADAREHALRGRGLLRGAHRRARARQRVRARPRARRVPRTSRRPTHEPISHLELVANAEVYLIAPASANTIAKLAAGLADNLLSSCALAASCPLVLAPAMNSRMYEHPATQANLQTLRERGVQIVSSPAAAGWPPRASSGIGRLAEPASCCCERLRRPRSPATAGEAATARAGRRCSVLVTAGGTREPIDSVRFVGNSSSGRMGFALAQAAARAALRSRCSPPTSRLRHPTGVRRARRRHGRRAAGACEQEFPGCDVLLMAAAVADFRPAAPANGKIKKAGLERLQLTLEPTRDVLASSPAARRAARRVVGFAAEHGEQAPRARARQADGQAPGRARRQRHLAHATSASTRTPTRSRSSRAADGASRRDPRSAGRQGGDRRRPSSTPLTGLRGGPAKM